MKSLSTYLTLVFLGGCIAGEEPATCRADQLQSLVGQDASVLPTMRFGGVTRILKLGQPMTMDHNPDRLNVLSDNKDVIMRVWCG